MRRERRDKDTIFAEIDSIAQESIAHLEPERLIYKFHFEAIE